MKGPQLSPPPFHYARNIQFTQECLEGRTLDMKAHYSYIDTARRILSCTFFICEKGLCRPSYDHEPVRKKAETNVSSWMDYTSSVRMNS